MIFKTRIKQWNFNLLAYPKTGFCEASYYEYYRLDDNEYFSTKK
jgi:hypothetical protein